MTLGERPKQEQAEAASPVTAPSLLVPGLLLLAALLLGLLLTPEAFALAQGVSP